MGRRLGEREVLQRTLSPQQEPRLGPLGEGVLSRESRVGSRGRSMIPNRLCSPAALRPPLPSLLSSSPFAVQRSNFAFPPCLPHSSGTATIFGFETTRR